MTPTTSPGRTPTVDAVAHATADRWEGYWAGIGCEEWLAAKALLDLSPRVAGHFACYLPTQPLGPDRVVAELDWQAAVAGIDGACFSSTERRLADLVAALVTGQPLTVSDLAWLGSWTRPVWRVLVEWATRGDLTTTPSRPRTAGGSR